MEHKILDRSQQDPANCWALEDLYATPADWERDLAELKDLTRKLAGFSGVFTTSADQLLALLWNDAYADRIVQFNNSRDAFGTAMYKLGLDVNTTDKADWDKAYDALLAQRPLVYSYVMDEIFNMMESGEASIGAYYAGDYFTMRDAQSDNVDLQFYYPDPTNFYIDAMCIPTCAEHKDLAEIFINYMLSEEPAVANAEYTSYASPNSLVYNSVAYQDDMGADAIAILYPELGDFAQRYNTLAYRNLDPDLLDYLNTLWENVKIN